MNSLTYAIATVCALALTNMVSGDEVQTNKTLRVTLHLSDGSRIIGSPSIASLPVQTAFAKMDIPLPQILQVLIESDHETVHIELANGDKLTGVLNLGPIELTTVFGRVAAGTEHIRSMQVSQSTGRTLPAKLQEGLALLYSFDNDEKTKVTDKSGKDRQGEVHGATWTPNGKVGAALQFDGTDDFVEVGNKPVLQLSRDFTLMAWINPEPSSDGFGIITRSHGAPVQQRRGVEFTLGNDDTLSAYFWDNSTRYFSGVVANRNIARKGWTHVVLQHDSTLPAHQMRAFINGQECPMNFGYEDVSSIPFVRNVTEPVRIGCMRPGIHHFKGLIDEVMLFERTLSASEVQQIYNLQK